MAMTRRRLILSSMVLLTVVLLAPLAVADLPPGGTFVDDDGILHEPNIEAIAAAGITNGCRPDRFCPSQGVTRGQMAAFLNRALDLPPAAESPFTDAGGVFQDDINRLAAAGITRGCSETRFCPDEGRQSRADGRLSQSGPRSAACFRITVHRLSGDLL